MGRLLILSVVVVGALSGTAVASAAQVVRTVRANLNHGHREKVQLLTGSKANPYGGTTRIPVRWVRVVDRTGGETVITRVSPRIEHLPWRRGLKVPDVGGDGRREIFYVGWRGNAGAVPVFAGVLGW